MQRIQRATLRVTHPNRLHLVPQLRWQNRLHLHLHLPLPWLPLPWLPLPWLPLPWLPLPWLHLPHSPLLLYLPRPPAYAHASSDDDSRVSCSHRRCHQSSHHPTPPQLKLPQQPPSQPPPQQPPSQPPPQPPQSQPQQPFHQKTQSPPLPSSQSIEQVCQGTPAQPQLPPAPTQEMWNLPLPSSQ